ncbi:hypothetical protein P4O66_003489 [Electrophorus voltai]|uniref:Gypsy retrotransposon integrase-like protein 1 n=1 Tax=Electrophorus voltai TaxID=2609070 RepID=A0AAD9DLH9_9TELE|nr:hypothetical protein P4O66_003489 [Electrophorus voltai]
MLSRQDQVGALPMSVEPVLPPLCFLGSLEWDMDQHIMAANPHPQCPPDHLYLLPKHWGALITWAHTSVVMGHPGATSTAQLIATRYWWPAMHKDCAHSKTPHIPPTSKLLPLPTPMRPWSHLAVDFVTDLPASEDNMVVLTVVDKFSKVVLFIPLKSLPTTLEMADLLFCQVFQQFGLPEDIVSDRGPQFTSRVLALPLQVCASALPLEHSHFLQSKPGARRARGLGRRQLRKAIAALKSKADRRRGETPQYALGQKVWVSTRGGCVGATGKLATKYEVPYRVKEKIHEVTYWVGLAGCSWASCAFHVSALKPVTQGPLAGKEGSSIDLPPPLPLEMDGVPAYKVMVLLESRRRGKGLQYLVDWEGYGPEEHSWVPAYRVLDPNLIVTFHRLHLRKPAPHRRGRLHSRQLAGSLGKKRGICNGRQIVIENEDENNTILTVNVCHNGTIMFEGSKASICTVQENFNIIRKTPHSPAQHRTDQHNTGQISTTLTTGKHGIPAKRKPYSPGS